MSSSKSEYRETEVEPSDIRANSKRAALHTNEGTLAA